MRVGYYYQLLVDNHAKHGGVAGYFVGATLVVLVLAAIKYPGERVLSMLRLVISKMVRAAELYKPAACFMMHVEHVPGGWSW